MTFDPVGKSFNDIARGSDVEPEPTHAQFCFERRRLMMQSQLRMLELLQKAMDAVSGGECCGLIVVTEMHDGCIRHRALVADGTAAEAMNRVLMALHSAPGMEVVRDTGGARFADKEIKPS